MRLFFLHAVLLFYGCIQYTNGYTVSVNSNRKFLFGDVLEPLCSIVFNSSEGNLTNSDLIELFHSWEQLTSSQISSGSISDYRKAMPCFPGPILTVPTSDDMIPPYPDCDTFVNISKTTIGEVEDLLEEIQKVKRLIDFETFSIFQNNGDQQEMDVSLKSVINSLSNRLQNLIDYLPDGNTKDKTETQLSNILSLSLQNYRNSTPKPFFHHPKNHSSPPKKFNPSQLLECFNISSFSPSDLLSLSSLTIGSIACSKFQICSFLDLSSNPCLGSLNITENQYESVINKTIGELIGQKMSGSSSILGQVFGRLARSKRTPKPGEEEEYEDVTPLMKMDGREEESFEDVVDESYGRIDSEDLLKRRMDEEEEEEGSGDGLSAPDLKEKRIQKLLETEESSGEFGNVEGSGMDSNDVFKKLDDKRSGKIHLDDVGEFNKHNESDDVTQENSRIHEGSGQASDVHEKRIQKLLDPVDARKSSEDILESSGDDELLHKKKFEETVVHFRVQGTEGSNSDDVASETNANDTLLQEFRGLKNQKDVNFDQALNFFKTQVTNGPNISESQELLNLLNTNMNSSMVESGISFLNSTSSIKEDIEKILPEMGNGEFTVAELLKKMNFSDFSSLKELLEDFGPLLGYSDVSGVLETLASKGQPIINKSMRTSDDVAQNEIKRNTRIQLEDVRDFRRNNESDDVTSESSTVVSGDSKFNEALSFFKTQISNESNIAESQELLNLLNTNLNSSMVEYGISSLNSTSPIKQEIEKILPKMGNEEFTVLDLLKKLNITDFSTVKELLEKIGSFFGVTDISGIVTSNKSLIANLLNTTNSSSSKSPELSKLFQKISDSSTLPTAIQNALNSNGSIISEAMNYLNPSLLSKLNV